MSGNGGFYNEINDFLTRINRLDIMILIKTKVNGQMKEKKRQDIIEAALTLFAERGYHVTSVQDIVNECGISKGAFYNYFSSKEELHIAIFQYYFDQIRNRIAQIEKEGLPPRERLIKQLNVPFEHVNKQKEYLMIFLREQSFSNHKEVKEYMKNTLIETYQWYKKSLLEVYGDHIKAFIGDLILVLEGIRKSYMSAIIHHNIELETSRIATFIMNRADEFVASFERGEKPIISEKDFSQSYLNEGATYSNEIEKARLILTEMKHKLKGMRRNDKSELETVLRFLMKEIEKNDFDKFVFQGVLANLKVEKEFDDDRKELAEILHIQLL